jgi:signal transduction histidine kinase
MVSMILLYFGVFKYDLLENEETIRSQNWLKDMIGNISHDLKTPLTILGQYLEILDDNTITLDELERTDYVHIAYNKNLNLQRLIRNLFEITRIESSQLVYNMEWQSAEDLASELEDKYAKFLASMDLSFSAICHKPCLIYLDRDKIWSVFNNIVFNAIRHTPHGGSISVTMQYSPDDIASGVCTITIADTGEGIEKQHLPHIFERFYKASRARNTGDSGIGLYIDQTNVHNMGGNITVESEPNKGTAFAITLAANEKGENFELHTVD